MGLRGSGLGGIDFFSALLTGERQQAAGAPKSGRLAEFEELVICFNGLWRISINQKGGCLGNRNHARHRAKAG
jgi:hypothetical protein